MRPLLSGLVAFVVVAAVVGALLGAIYGTKGTVVIVTPPPAPSPPTPTPTPTPESGLVTWTAGDAVAGLTSSHPLSYGCSTTLLLPHQGSVNRSLVEACYAANLTLITEASDLLCGILAAATVNVTYLTVTCPANCSFAAGLAAMILDPDLCGLDTEVEQIENVLLKLSGSQAPAPVQLDRIDQRALPLDGTFNYTYNGTGSVVFVLDTGVDPDHADLLDKVVSRVDLTFAPATTGDCLGHGTAVASQAVGEYAGVSKAATVVDVRITDCAGVTAMGNLLAALSMVGHGYTDVDHKVVAVPVGPLFDATSQSTMASLIADDNAVVVAAAGNDGLSNCPGSAPANLFIGALDVLGNDTRASFSHYGSCVQLAAPGVGNTVALRATAASYTNLSGTSYAAGVVAGAALMAWSDPANAGFTAAQVIQLLLLAATDDLPNTAFALVYTADFGGLTTATSATPTIASPTHATPTVSTASASSATPTVGTTHTPTVASATPSPLCTNYTSHTQGGWAQVCRTSAPTTTPTGCLRDTSFADAFPVGLRVGCPLTTSPSFRRLNFTTSYAVNLFLPLTAAPALLGTSTGTVTNPSAFTAGNGGELSANLVAAKLNVGFDLYDPAFSQCTGELQNLCYYASDPTVGSTCGGRTLANVIKAADLILGKCSAVNICAGTFVDPDDAALCLLTPAQINTCLSLANNNYLNGNGASQGVLVPCT